MLEPWALAYRAWKKKIAWQLYQRRDLHAVTVFHATSEMEAESIRRQGLRQPVIVLPNGVVLPCATRRPKADGEFREALFLSRIHPKKGLDLLVTAWSRLRPPGWRLTIAGNDDGGYKTILDEMIRNSGAADSIRYVGPAYGESKDALYREADLFVLPSHSENFGIVVVEALAWSIPVITTTGTPWNALATEGCGWWVPVTEAGIAGALAEATSLSSEALASMGRKGRRLTEVYYDWDSIALRFREAYALLAARDHTALRALSFVRVD